MIAVRPAVATVLLGVRPYTLRRLIGLGELRLLHCGGRPLVGIASASLRGVARAEEERDPRRLAAARVSNTP